MHAAVLPLLIKGALINVSWVQDNGIVLIEGGKTVHGRLTAFPNLSNGLLCITHAVSQHALVPPLLSLDICAAFQTFAAAGAHRNCLVHQGDTDQSDTIRLLQLARTTRDSATMSQCEPA